MERSAFVGGDLIESGRLDEVMSPPVRFGGNWNVEPKQFAYVDASLVQIKDIAQAEQGSQ